MSKIVQSVKSGISRALSYISYALLFIATLSIALPLIYLTQNQDIDSLRINVSGRQRMLSQKMIKDVLLYHNDKISMEAVNTTISLFDSSLDALIYGGGISGLTDKITLDHIPGIEDKAIKNQLLMVKDMWQKYKDHLLRYMQFRDEESLKYLLDNNDSFLDEIDTSVFMIEAQAKRLNVIIQIMIIVGIVLVMAVIGISLMRKRTELKKARYDLKALEKILPICANCKKIRVSDEKADDPASWLRVEDYLKEKKDMLFTHTICPVCASTLYPDLMDGEKTDTESKPTPE
ncbi:MAG: type IV pili methyl-accepting chemotaxis transducer N-terminal domain-containing protein [Spirochaetales bacterium]|nr:type IV pili methyl-accepting chemotaxis transducer N-terminal domain-containing protein [Spirochaetales bacterium]